MCACFSRVPFPTLRWRPPTKVSSRAQVKDFPPVAGSLDAHALWHAATPPLTFVFYRFLVADAAVNALNRVPGGLAHKQD